MKMYHFNEIAKLHVSVLPAQLMTADNFHKLKMFLVLGIKNYKNQSLKFLSLKNLKWTKV